MAWLTVVPVSTNELGYAYEHGMDALVQLLEEEESVDVANWTRASVV